uniref:PDZ domain-containing protein n=1 Tax=Leersia perrieri TaxID=77586 RepID=A0A0D9WD40_9ORYZ
MPRKRSTTPAPAGAGPPAESATIPVRRVTRLRSRELKLEPEAPPEADPRDVASDDPEVGNAAAKGKSAANSPSPPRRPPYPKSGEFEHDPGKITPCTLRMEPKDPRTARDVVTTADKIMVRKAARSIVGISSYKPDGEGIAQCTGIVVDWNEIARLATIVTCSEALCVNGALIHPEPKLLIHMPNRAIGEGRLLFFNAHYRIALLEVLTDSPLQPAMFCSSPRFGQEVFALARDDESSLIVRHGTVLWQEPPSYLAYRHWLSLGCKLAPCGTGGPVIDEHGAVIGMAFVYIPNPYMLSISIMRTCIEMWMKFSRVARPILGMNLRTIEFLDISSQEDIEVENRISNGFIVHMVYDDSTPERLGISEGDVIVSYGGKHDFTLHKFEDFLLSLGWEFLASADSNWTVDLEF